VRLDVANYLFPDIKNPYFDDIFEKLDFFGLLSGMLVIFYLVEL
jgi:hypothetical protein